jgi:hypothetical protein
MGAALMTNFDQAAETSAPAQSQLLEARQPQSAQSESTSPLPVIIGRKAETYRGARRNADRVKGWPEATFAKSRPQLDPIWIPLNRSKHLPFANTYERAREIAARKKDVGAIA